MESTQLARADNPHSFFCYQIHIRETSSLLPSFLFNLLIPVTVSEKNWVLTSITVILHSLPRDLHAHLRLA